jgi:hypothetical protein
VLRLAQGRRGDVTVVDVARGKYVSGKLMLRRATPAMGHLQCPMGQFGSAPGASVDIILRRNYGDSP